MRYIYWYRVTRAGTHWVERIDWTFSQEVCVFFAILWLGDNYDVETWVTYDEE